MRWFKRRAASGGVFTPPNKSAHRGFVYLDDDIVINSLSAIESGKVDEVVEKINLAQERGMNVTMGLGAGGANASAGASGKSSESLQAEVIRRRTRFSIFELWYEALTSRQSLGRFDGWDGDALSGVEPGHVVELQGRVEPVGLHVGIRLYMWFANEVRQKNPLFKETSIKDIEQPEKNFKALRGKRFETSALIVPDGDEGPKVIASFRDEWMVEPLGRWNGRFRLVAQVDDVLDVNDNWQLIRLIDEAPLTPLERKVIEEAYEPILGAMSENIGVEADSASLSVDGPALILRPIALFR